MKQSCVSAFTRAARFVALTAVVLAVGASSLFAQAATGKIEGKVRDQQGAPIANAQVIIVGTKFGAQTNADGYYFINLVPAGSVTLQASFIGYKKTQVTDLRVLSGQTITADITMESTPVEVTEITVVAAQNELVPRDAVTTKQNVQGEYTDKLPVDRINNALALQPGVVASTSGNTLSIRGGRVDEGATYIDGVPTGAGNRGAAQDAAPSTNGVSVGTNGFEDASITTGGASAAFGGAQSGIISIATRTGGSKFTGAVGYETDGLFGNSVSLGFNRVTASLGGPIVSNLTFFLSGAAEGSQSNGALGTAGVDRADSPYFVAAGTDTVVAVPSARGDPLADTAFVTIQNLAVYTGKCDQTMSYAGINIKDITPAAGGMNSNYGLDCQGIRIPYTAVSTYQVQGKLNYSYGTGSRIFLSGIASQGQNRGWGGGLAGTYTAIYNPQVLTAATANNQVYTLGITQNLSKSAARALALDLNLSYQRDQYISGPMTRESEANSRAPWGGFMLAPLKYQFNFDNFPLNDELLKNWQQNLPTRQTPYDVQNVSQYAQVDNWRNNAYGVTGFSESGGPTGAVNLSQENRWIGSAALDWQLDRYNRLKLGGAYTKFDITSYSSGLTSQYFSDFFMEKPTSWTGYAEDRLDLGDVVLVAGLRYDYYNSNGSHPQFCRDASTGGTPASDSAISCQLTARISTNPMFDPNNAEASLDSIYKPDQSHNYLSPHLQVSFPVSDRTNMRFSYAHQVQAPDFSLIYSGVNTDIDLTNSNQVYGADLDFGKTITFEFGIRHAFSDDMVLDFSAYNRDVQANAAGRLLSVYDPVKLQYNDLRYYTNQDFGNYRGFDIRLDKRIGSLFNGTLAYSFADAKNTGSDPNTYINFGSRVVNQLQPNGAEPPPSSYLPTTYTRPHNLAGSFSVTFPNGWNSGSTMGAILQNVGVFATFRVASGTAYTVCPSASGNEGNLSPGVCSKGNFDGDQNGARLPTFRNTDLRVTKGFRFGAMDLTAYLDVRNLFNFSNTVQVFSTTNGIENAAELQEVWAGDSGSYAKEAAASGAYDNATGAMTLPSTGGCDSWSLQNGNPGAPNCIYLIRAEQRFGNGDGVFSLAEQRRASAAYYYTGRSNASFTAAPRRMRLGLELNF
ncbi:MAG TPA: TonB-dependent receptor [Gemmatimonadales bacterium]|nr:TonB-dependent receptor [Gemmatimonadales bacterium]